MTYTFITYYRGGTYIEQIEAPDLNSAMPVWAVAVAQNAEIAYLDSAAFLKAFQEDHEEFPPTPIEDRPNVWSFFLFSGRNRLEVTIVKTSLVAEPAHSTMMVR